MNDKWTLYKDKKSEWRWKRVASNGRTVGASTEGYKNRSECIENAQRNGCEIDLTPVSDSEEK
ncbi:MAG: DUF1508 domain-containing protein [Verrucomicrobiales bacterium]|nr:DUF1508 domain-containing protein [Verrucomicrobiae bacterium]